MSVAFKMARTVRFVATGDTLRTNSRCPDHHAAEVLTTTAGRWRVLTTSWPIFLARSSCASSGEPQAEHQFCPAAREPIGFRRAMAPPR